METVSDSFELKSTLRRIFLGLFSKVKLCGISAVLVRRKVNGDWF